jgi:transglutaminase-like putative cysteine protease
MRCKQPKTIILGHHTIDNDDHSPQFTKKQKQEKASNPPSNPPSTNDNPPPLLFVDDFSNIHHPEIERLVGELKKSTTSDRDFAKAAFGWVRDNIKYCVLPDWTVPVEFTLEHREGQCSTKSCLLVTLLRAAGLEAAFYIVRPFDTGRKMFLLPPWIKSILSHEGVHFLVGVKLDGHWVKLDPSFDRRLCFGLQNACPERNYLAKFDGFHDALVTGDFYTGSELTPVQNIDVYMRKKHRVPSIVHKCMNVCFDCIRDSSRRNTNVEDLIVEMESHLSNEYNLNESSLG